VLDDAAEFDAIARTARRPVASIPRTEPGAHEQVEGKVLPGVAALSEKK
jgi:hypothetical protein